MNLSAAVDALLVAMAALIAAEIAKILTGGIQLP